MAESTVSATEGSGAKKFHTFSRSIGGLTVEDEIVVLGDQYLATYSAVSGSGISAATAAAHWVQIMAGASLPVYVRRIKVTQVAMATAAAMADLLVLRLTTAGTGGTALGTPPWDSTDPASGGTVMTLPTAKGTEGNTLWRESVYFAQTLGASQNAPFGVLLDWDCDRLRTKPFRIPAGAANGLALKCNTAVAAATVTVSVLFTEATF